MADKVKRGLSYVGPDGVGKRAEAGDVVSDLPEASRGWLIDQGVIEPVDGAEPPAAEPAREVAAGGKRNRKGAK